MINVGLRYDAFDANTTYPSQRRNPVNASTYYLKNIDGLVARLMEKKNSWWMADAIEEGVYRRAVESIIEEIDEDK